MKMTKQIDGLTATDIIAIESGRYATLDEAELHANDLNNHDLPDDWNADVIRLPNGQYVVELSQD
jgi:hypothetical protein